MDNEKFWAWTVLVFMAFVIFMGAFLMAQTVKINNTLKAIQAQQIEWQNQESE